jgi:hypothetical protein
MALLRGEQFFSENKSLWGENGKFYSNLTKNITTVNLCDKMLPKKVTIEERFFI